MRCKPAHGAADSPHVCAANEAVTAEKHARALAPPWRARGRGLPHEGLEPRWRATPRGGPGLLRLAANSAILRSNSPLRSEKKIRPVHASTSQFSQLLRLAGRRASGRCDSAHDEPTQSRPRKEAQAKAQSYHAKQPKLSFGGYSAGGGSSAPAAASSSSTPPAAALPNETLPSQAGTSAEGSTSEIAEMADAEHEEDVRSGTSCGRVMLVGVA